MSMSEIKIDTWMPLYVSDYLADTSHLSTEEHGAYLLLLMHAWMNGGELPTDDNRLRRIARMDEKPWKASRDEIKSFFYEHDGAFRHARVDRELQRAQQHVNQRSAAGKASAAKRKAERECQRNGNDRSTSVATEGERECQRNGKPPPPPSPLTPMGEQPPLHPQPESREKSADVAASIPDPPTTEGHWLTWFNREAGTSFDAGSRFDRDGLWPIFRRWCDSRISQQQMRDAVKRAFETATEPIANLPKYVDRVLANSQRPEANQKPTPGQKTAAAAARWLESQGVTP